MARSRSEREKRAKSTYEQFKLSYGPLIAACLRLGHDEEALITAERALSSSFLNLMGGKDLSSRERLSERRQGEAEKLKASLAELEARLGTLDQADEGEERASVQRDLAVQGGLLQTLNARIETDEAEVKSLSSVDPLTVREIQTLLGDATLVEYCGHTAGDLTQSFVAVVTADSFEVVKDVSFYVHDVQDWVVAFRIAGEQSAGKGKADAAWDAACRDLYDRLFKPVRELVKTRQVIIVPFGAMNLVPFACLTDERGRRLVENHVISYVPSGSVLKFCQAKRMTELKKALVLANPFLSEPGSQLKFAESEAEAVAQLFPESMVLRGTQATESAFVTLAPEYDVLHLACHGVMDRDDAMLSSLRLATDDRNDGALLVREIFDLNLNAGLITLSACNTGTGELTGSGFEFLGMTRAFLYAGTPSVVASLWRVDDRATAELMGLFYKNMLAGQTKSEALQRAQLEMMKKYENPYYWGAFVLYGDYR